MVCILYSIKRREQKGGIIISYLLGMAINIWCLAGIKLPWRSGTSQNYGIMLVGTDESERKDNNSFYSEYELLGIDGEQAYDW